MCSRLPANERHKAECAVDAFQIERILQKSINMDVVRQKWRDQLSFVPSH